MQQRNLRISINCTLKAYSSSFSLPSRPCGFQSVNSVRLILGNQVELSVGEELAHVEVPGKTKEKYRISRTLLHRIGGGRNLFRVDEPIITNHSPLTPGPNARPFDSVIPIFKGCPLITPVAVLVLVPRSRVVGKTKSTQKS